MKVKKLIEELQILPDDCEVCRADSESGDIIIKSVELTEAISPEIKYVVIT